MFLSWGRFGLGYFWVRIYFGLESFWAWVFLHYGLFGEGGSVGGRVFWARDLFVILSPLLFSCFVIYCLVFSCIVFVFLGFFLG